MSFFAFLPSVMRRILFPKVRSGDLPRGIRTASMFVSPADLDDAGEVEAFAESVARFYVHLGDDAPHPAFGRLPRERIEQIHSAHAAHHLRFLAPPRIEYFRV